MTFYKNCNSNAGDDTEGLNNSVLPFYTSTNMLQPNDGLLWILHSPNNFPSTADQTSYLRFQADNDVIVMLDMFMIDDELKSWPPEKRNCYLPGEKELSFFKIYTKTNCEQECLSEATSKKCGCVPFYLISERKSVCLFKTQLLCILGGFEMRICVIKDIQCYKTVQEEFYAADDVIKTCSCLGECNYVKYRMNCEQYIG